jgi:lipocalin
MSARFSPSSKSFGTSVLVFATLLFSSQLALAQFSQQGPKLSSGAFGSGEGYSVALSSDGSTAIVGGPSDNDNIGAAWVYTRSNGVWTQQGNKLVGTGAVGNAQQGQSVALSADGNTAIVGGWADNSGIGAAWVFARSGGVWTQQGTKLVGIGAVGYANQGFSVSLSADGSTAIVGGWADKSNTGAAWVYARGGTAWTQQGNKLVGTGAIGIARQGYSVSLSGDGNTVIVGGWADNSGIGAAWVFARSGGIWNQQGSKLVGTGAVGVADQGNSVALSADGNTAIVGGPADNSNTGATWVFARNNGVWTQQGNKLVGTAAVGGALQGISVSLSGNGSTAIVGGPADNSDAGAAWVFALRNGVWTQQGNKLVGTGAVGIAGQGPSVWLSDDGSAAIVGGPGDNSATGAAWVFVQPLQVTPTTDVTASGPKGGPFSPSSFSYTLSATSGSVLYSITTPSWLTASPKSGTVTTQGQTITFKINSSADKLLPKTYSGTISFYDTTTSQPNVTLNATLTVSRK